LVERFSQGAATTFRHDHVGEDEVDRVEAALRAAETPAQTAAPAYNLGRIEQAAGRIDEAVTSFELALAAMAISAVVLGATVRRGE